MQCFIVLSQTLSVKLAITFKTLVGITIRSGHLWVRFGEVRLGYGLFNIYMYLPGFRDKKSKNMLLHITLSRSHAYLLINTSPFSIS